MTTSIEIFIEELLLTTSNEKTFLQTFSNNSEAKGLEFVEFFLKNVSSVCLQHVKIFSNVLLVTKRLIFPLRVIYCYPKNPEKYQRVTQQLPV